MREQDTADEIDGIAVDETEFDNDSRMVENYAFIDIED